MNAEIIYSVDKVNVGDIATRKFIAIVEMENKINKIPNNCMIHLLPTCEFKIF